MEDKEGISIISNKDIKMSADKNIDILSTKNKVQISGQSEVMLKQGASSYIKLK